MIHNKYRRKKNQLAGIKDSKLDVYYLLHVSINSGRAAVNTISFSCPTKWQKPYTCYRF